MHYQTLDSYLIGTALLQFDPSLVRHPSLKQRERGAALSWSDFYTSICVCRGTLEPTEDAVFAWSGGIFATNEQEALSSGKNGEEDQHNLICIYYPYYNNTKLVEKLQRLALINKSQINTNI